jgi:trehalose 6-phosphate phosphatase
MKQDISYLLKEAVHASSLLLFLDYDGTLADFARTPDTIIQDPELIELFQKMSKSPRLYPFVISGRRLSHIQKLLPVKGIFLAGTYGLEMQLPNGELRNILHFEEVRPKINQLLPIWEKIIKNQTGYYIEDKGWSIALHAGFTGHPDLEVVMSAAKMASDELNLGPDFYLFKNPRFIEFAPIKANKTFAVRRIINEFITEDALPVYIGDDEKDEEAFFEVIKLGGYAVRVSSQLIQTRAQFQMTDPSEVRSWLQDLVQLR